MVQFQEWRFIKQKNIYSLRKKIHTSVVAICGACNYRRMKLEWVGKCEKRNFTRREKYLKYF